MLLSQYAQCGSKLWPHNDDPNNVLAILIPAYMWQIEVCGTFSIHLCAEQHVRQMHAQLMPTYKTCFFHTHTLHTHNHKKQRKWHRESLEQSKVSKNEIKVHTSQTGIDKSSMF